MLWIFGIAAICLVATSHADESTDITEEDHVLVLTTKNFDHAISKYKYLLVEFYAPWCGHCKALAPEYATAAKQLHGENSEIHLAKVDATVESALAERHEVQGYPTLKFYKNGHFSDYKGGRKANLIIEWLKKKTGPVLQEIETADEAKAFLDKHEIAVLGFLKSETAQKTLSAVADEFEEGVAFAFTKQPKLFTEYSIADDDELVLFRKFDDPKLVMPDFSANTEAEKVKDFIKENQLPLVVEFSAEVAPKVFGGEIKKHVLLFESSKAADIAEKKSALKEVAKAFRGKVICLHIDTDEEEHERILDFFGIKKSDVPELRAVIVGRDLSKFRPENEDFSAEYLKEFVQRFIDGKLKVSLLSQPLPDDWDKEPVKVLVSSNLKAIVSDPKKRVFVEFYAPWCGHCKALKPTWDQLAEAYADADDVVIAKVDSTANEIEDIKIESFPTLKFFPKADGKYKGDEVLNYSGERTLAAFKKFIDSNGADVEKPAAEEEDDEEEEEEHKGEKKNKDEL